MSFFLERLHKERIKATHLSPPGPQHQARHQHRPLSWRFSTVRASLVPPRPARQVRREGERRHKCFLFSKGLRPIFTATLCHAPEQKCWGGRAANFTIECREKGWNILQGHLSAFAHVLNPVPPVLRRTRIMAENLSLLSVCTIANVIVEALHA